MFVDAARANQLPEVIADKLLAHVFDIDFRGTCLESLLFEPVEFLAALADVAANGDDLAAVVLLQPGNDDGCIEATGIGERYLLCNHVTHSICLLVQNLTLFRQAAEVRGDVRTLERTQLTSGHTSATHSSRVRTKGNAGRMFNSPDHTPIHAASICRLAEEHLEACRRSPENCELLQQREKEGLLDVQPVFGLVKDHRLR